MIWSPSTTVPCSSTATTRSASPSSASPASAPRPTTALATRSGCVEPTPALMLRPSGSAPITVTVAPSARNAAGATSDAAPFAQSSTTWSAANGVPPPAAATSWPTYPSTASVTSATRPGPSGASIGAPSSRMAWSAASIAASVSSRSLRPPRSNSFTPLSLQRVVARRDHRPGGVGPGARDREPGVGSTPNEWASPPARVMPSTSAASSAGPDSRVSRPTRNGRPRRSARTAAAPSARRSAAVRSVSASPRTPSVPKREHARALRVYRLEYCGALRAFLRPYLRRSFSRASRARRPAFFSARPGLGVERDERPGDAEPDGAGLAADAAAVERRVDVVDLFGLREPQRLLGDHLVR